MFCVAPSLRISTAVNKNKVDTDQVLTAFVETLDRLLNRLYEMYLLEIATGLRRGELLGLKWTDVNYDADTIYVQRQICRIDGAVTEGPLKTKNSY